MTTLPPGIPFSQDAPVNTVKRAAVAGPVEILERKLHMKSGQAASKPAATDVRAAHKESTTEMGAHGNEGAWRDGNERRNV
jgi:hypothetical protein